MTENYEARPGEDISTAVKALVALANEKGAPATCTFNGIALVAKVGDNADEILAAWNAGMEEARVKYEQKRAAWRLTPEGIEATRKEEERAAKLKALNDGPMPVFSLKDEAGWKKAVDANQDEYGAAVMRYAAYWASLMEAAMKKGVTIEACAQQCSSDADLEGITGFMYGCAVSTLAKAWKHGDALRRWHNKATQLGTEGDKANETGGTLNPALLTMETPAP